MIEAFPKQDFANFVGGYGDSNTHPRDNPIYVSSGAHGTLVSIIIPVYNVVEYIEDCLNSVRNQIYRNIEVIIVNDGCTDNTMNLVHQCVRGWDKVKIVNQENLGLGGARNTGLDHSTGDYIIFVDSDDAIKPDHVSRLMEAAVADPNIDIVTSQCSFIDEQGVDIPGGKSAFRAYYTLQGKRLSAAEQLLGLYSASVAWGRLYRARLIRESDLRFPNHLPHEDWFFTYKAFYRAKRVKSIENKTYLYRIRQGSLSKSISKIYVDSLELIIIDTFEYINKADLGDLAWDLYARRIAIAIHSLGPRIKISDQQTRDAFGKFFQKHYALIISSIARLNKGPLSGHWQPEGIIDWIRPLIDGQYKRLVSYRETAIRAPEFYFKSPETRIQTLKDIYRGERCFIIGNGPSLNEHDLELLHGEASFAVNSFFYKSEETGFMPTFYVVEDSKVAEERAEEINSYPYPYKLFPNFYRDKFVRDAYNTSYFNMDMGFYKTGGPFYCVPRFSEDAAEAVIAGQTVTYANMQLAYYMGFTEVYLIGMDFHYVIPAEHKISGNHILSTTDDPNHFHKDYFGVGKTWKDPKLDRVAMNYRQAKVAYEAAGRKIYNATIGGKLEIFDRVDYEALLRDPATGKRRSQRVAPVVIRLGEGASGEASEQLAEPYVGLAAPTPGPQSAPITTAGHSLAPPQKQPEPTGALIAGSSPVGPAQEAFMASEQAPEASPADLPQTERNQTPRSASAISQSPATDITPAQPARIRPWYAPAGDALRRIVPSLYPALQEGRRSLWRLAGLPLAWLSGLAALGVLSWAAFAPGPFGGRVVVVSIVLGALAVAGLGAIAWRLRRAIQTLSAENRRLAEDVAFIHELAAGREGRVDRILEEQTTLKQDVGSIRNAQGRDGAALRSELAALKAASSQDAAALKQEMSGLKSAQARDVNALQSNLSRAVDDVRAVSQATQSSLRDELNRLEAEAAQVAELLKAEIVRSGQSARTDSEAALRSELIRLKADQAETSKALREEIVRNGQEVRDSVDATLLAELSRLEAALAERASTEAAALRGELAQLQAELDQKIKARAASTGASFGRAAQAARRREAALQEQIASLQAALSRIEDETTSAQAAAAEGDAALREELKAVRQGLEQRLRAEVDEAMAQSVGELAERIEASARDAAADDAQLREDMAALREALEQRLAADVEAGKADVLAQAEQRLAAELGALEARLAAAGGETADALREELRALQGALKSAQDTAAGAQAAAAEGDDALRDELQAVRQGLEQRLRAEVDEATAERVSSLLQRIDATAENAKSQDAALRQELQSLRETSAQSDTALETSVKTIKGRLESTQAHSVSLHVTSALRALRPLWTGGSAVQALKEQAEVEHGHELLMAVLADEEKASPGMLAGKTLIEIGTTRENVPSQSSTQKLAIFAALTGLRFITVDMDPANTTAARNILRYINPGAQALTQKGETYLRQHPTALEFIYLDAFDFDHGQHSEARQDSYRKHLGTEINDPACWKMHEDCAETIIARMVPDGIIVLDDTWTDEEGRYAGKGKLAAPLLLENGFSLIAKTRRTLALKKANSVRRPRGG